MVKSSGQFAVKNMTVSLRFLTFYGQLEVDVRLPHGQQEVNRRSSIILPVEHAVSAASMRLP